MCINRMNAKADVYHLVIYYCGQLIMLAFSNLPIGQFYGVTPYL